MHFIKKIFYGIIASGLAIFITSYYFSEYISVQGGIKAFFISGLIFGILNGFLKPILKIISLPFVILTAGLFTFLINGFVIFLTEYFLKQIPSLGIVFEIQGGFFSYIIIAVILGIINYITHLFVGK